MNAVCSDSLQDEVQMMAKLYHPRITLFLGACVNGKEISVVSEMLDGDIEHVILKDRGIPLFQRVLWARQAALGMAWVHGAGHHSPRSQAVQSALLQGRKRGQGVRLWLHHSGAGQDQGPADQGLALLHGARAAARRRRLAQVRRVSDACGADEKCVDQ
jgi:serine/threonine protein kinase